MPQPTASDVHYSRPLTNISVAYLQSLDTFIASKVFPVVPVSKQGNRYTTYEKSYWNRIVAQKRTPATASAGGGYGVNNDNSYYCDVWALHKDVDDETRANSDDQINPDRDATEYVSRNLMLAKENDWTSAYFTTGIWTGDQTGVSSGPSTNEFLQWNDASSTPIKNIQDQLDIVQQRTGFRPNKLVLGPQVFTALKDNPDILDRIKYSQRGVITRDILAMLFEVDEVLVPYGIYTTTDEGVVEASQEYSFFFGKAALLIYAAPNPGLLIPSGGYTFAWTGLLGASAMGHRMTTFRMKELKADRVEGEMAFDQKVIAADLGVFFVSAVA